MSRHHAGDLLVKYRLLAVDLDGTVALDGQMPTEGVRAAIQKAVTGGTHVVVATGRPYESAITFSDFLGLSSPVICFQGAMVRETAGARRVLYSARLPLEPLQDVVAFLAGSDFEITLYSEDTLYRSDTRHPTPFWQRWFGLHTEVVSDLRDVVARAGQGGSPLVKALIIGTPEGNDRLAPELRERFAGRLDVVRSHPLFVELTAPGVCKGQALAFLADYLGVRREETVAAGDSGNDVSMVRWAGLGVAMANATPEVLAVADWVAPSVSEDGITELVARYLSGNGHAR
jgi:hypothetical protein